MLVIAEIPHKGNKLTVEIVDVWTGGSGVKLATVRAFIGQPFQSWTHGGWCPSDTANFPAGLLRDVRIESDQEATQGADANGR